jgi:hypothetical protein
MDEFASAVRTFHSRGAQEKGSNGGGSTLREKLSTPHTGGQAGGPRASSCEGRDGPASGGEPDGERYTLSLAARRELATRHSGGTVRGVTTMVRRSPILLIWRWGLARQVGRSCLRSPSTTRAALTRALKSRGECPSQSVFGVSIPRSEGRCPFTLLR